jgi:hypothetical protein
MRMDETSQFPVVSAIFVRERADRSHHDSADKKIPRIRSTLFHAVNVPNGPNRLGPLGSDGLKD